MLFCALIDSDAFHGTATKNPFRFNDHGIRQISAEVDGVSYPTKPYNMNFASKKWLEPYDGLLDVLGRKHAPYGSLMFDRTEYGQGYTIFGFCLSPTGSGFGELGLIKQGNLSISLMLTRALPHTCMLFSLLVFDSEFEIDHFRQLFTDFAG